MATHRSDYKSELKRFLRFRFGLPPDEVDEEMMIQISDADVAKYMNHLAFGTEDPGEGDLPTKCRSNTLKGVKRMLSAFMPRKNVTWDDVTKQGNPTRSVAVNDVITAVIRFEVRRQGVPSQSRRELEYTEYLQLLEMVRISPHFSDEQRYKVSAVITLQWHLIGRIDDMMKLKLVDVFGSNQFPFLLMSQLRWSKNIREEREAPKQHILGSMDPRMCCLLNLAVFGEMRGGGMDAPGVGPAAGAEENEFLFGGGGGADHRKVRSALEKIFGTTTCVMPTPCFVFYMETNELLVHLVTEDPAFRRKGAGKLGTHSLRKGPATYCSRGGMQRDYIGARGRWHEGKRQVDTYIAIDKPYPDALIAAFLCGHTG